MPQASNRRFTGLALALALNAAFFAMFAWNLRPAPQDHPEPARVQLVWAAPKPDPAATPSRPAARPDARLAAAARTPAAPQTAPVPATVPEAIAQEQPDAPDPFAQVSSVTSRALDKGVMHAAIKTALDEQKALEDTQKFVKVGHAKNQYERFADGADYATMPYCGGAGAMKFTPPQVKVARLTIPLGGVLAAPFLVKAIGTGKCRVK